MIIAKSFERADRNRLRELVRVGILKELICNE
jgi:hypothetical protein